MVKRTNAYIQRQYGIFMRTNAALVDVTNKKAVSCMIANREFARAINRYECSVLLWFVPLFLWKNSLNAALFYSQSWCEPTFRETGQKNLHILNNIGAIHSEYHNSRWWHNLERNMNQIMVLCRFLKEGAA